LGLSLSNSLVSLLHKGCIDLVNMLLMSLIKVNMMVFSVQLLSLSVPDDGVVSHLLGGKLGLLLVRKLALGLDGHELVRVGLFLGGGSLS
jgi:hypothetical protein